MAAKGQYLKQYKVGEQVGNSGAIFLREAGLYVPPDGRSKARLIECVCANEGCTNTFIAQENRIRKGLRSGLCDECRRCSKNKHIIGYPINEDFEAPIFLGWVRKGSRRAHGIAKYHCTRCDTNDFVRDMSDCESNHRYVCPSCLNRQRVSSNGEEKVASLLSELGYAYLREKTFEDCVSPAGNKLRFDFFLPQEFICIEYDGEQHFVANNYFGGEAQLQKTQKHDKIKDEWCRNHSIPLIRIPYTVYDKNLLNISYLSDKLAIARKER